MQETNANQATVSCPASNHPQYWIEIQLFGEDDRPVAFESYELVLPDGSIVQGQLDADGLARVDAIQTNGICKCRFPELDKDAWELISPK
jgi:hypothetical protein